MPERGAAGERITVVVPYFRDPAGLAATIDALRRQTIGPERFIVVVVDNEPDVPVPVDGSGLSLRLVPEARPGSFSARETGRIETATELLAFTDAGCVPRPDWLERGVAALDDGASVDVVAGAVEVVVEPGRRPSLAARYELARGFPVAEYVERFGFGITANLLTRRSVFERFGGFDPALLSGGDAEWCQRVGAGGGTVRFTGDVVVGHPARTTIGALVRKARRVSGGLHDRMVRDGDTRAYLRHNLWRDALPPVRPSIALLRGSWRHPFTAVGLVGIEVLLNAVRLGERARLLVGRGQSIRA